MRQFNIQPVSTELSPKLQQKIDGKTKPTGSLGCLEEIAKRIGLIQMTLSPNLIEPTIIVFAGDHGIASEGVSAYPQSVTAQMVCNFLQGGAAISVFCRQHGINLRVVDAGVNHDFPKDGMLIDAKIAKGTRNFLHEDAMTFGESTMAIEKGIEVVEKVSKKGCNIIGFGEMGIGNTSSASLLMSALCNIPVSECVGRGTGLDDSGLRYKASILKQASLNHTKPMTSQEALVAFGGFEVAEMCGAMLRAAEQRKIILVDGFTASVALLTAFKLNINVLDYAIFSHRSDEAAHGRLLEYFRVRPILDLSLRLGEGTGCAMAFPIIESAVAFLNEMASFESAGVSRKNE